MTITPTHEGQILIKGFVRHSWWHSWYFNIIQIKLAEVSFNVLVCSFKLHRFYLGWFFTIIMFNYILEWYFHWWIGSWKEKKNSSWRKIKDYFLICFNRVKLNNVVIFFFLDKIYFGLFLLIWINFIDINVCVCLCVYVYVCVLVTQLCPTPCDLMNCSQPGPSVHGLLQARILEWVAISFSKRSSLPWDQTLVSHIAGRFFTI